jgi:EmrB/QacA subfamily drug resistance transporter
MTHALSRRGLIWLTLGILLGIFMASMEATVVATAMPTIVGQLGGLEAYSWVFSGYMLTSTTTVPLYGKFSDLYGRRRVYAVAMLLSLAGSLLCGLAQTMQQLIVFRLLQGLGAGGLLPLAFIIIGDLYSFEQRARMQGLFAGVWGVSAVVGPLLGGFLVDQVSWHWVFFINLLPGLLSLAVVWWGLRQGQARAAHAVRVDYAGAGLLTLSVSALLLGLLKLDQLAGWGLVLVAAGLAAALVWVERRAPDPILPLGLFRDRLFVIACLHGVLAGWAMFGSLAYVPLFVQGVLGTNATTAGSTLAPLMLSWVTSSIIGTRLILRIPYRVVVVGGMGLFIIGALMLARIHAGTSLPALMAALAMMGVGMGLSVPIFLILVQSAVERRWLGIATSTLQFTRSIGGTIGVSVMGAALSLWLAGNLATAGLDPSTVSASSLLDPLASAGASTSLDGALRGALGGAIQGVFIIGFVGALLAFAATALTPAAPVKRDVPQPAAIGD